MLCIYTSYICCSCIQHIYVVVLLLLVAKVSKENAVLRLHCVIVSGMRQNYSSKMVFVRVAAKLQLAMLCYNVILTKRLPK